MAKIDKPINREQLYKEISNDHKATINKMLELQDILINDPPSDKKFNNNVVSYLLEYLDILTDVKYTDYNDEHITHSINVLYDKVFKHRRY